ncbi:MAG: flagellar biosynthetic protein FliO [Candidatus Caldatribacteriota bacterium]
MNRKFVAIVIFSLFTQMALAGVKVSTLNYENKGQESVLKIAVEGKSNDLPEISVNDQLIEISLGEADDFKTINKKQGDVTLTAKTSKGRAVVWAKLPFKVNQNEVNLGWKNNQVEITFPTGKIIKEKKTVTATPKAAAPAPKVVETKKAVAAKEALNEEYLNKISKQIEKIEEKKVAAKEIKKDTVTTTQSAIGNKPQVNNTFSFAGYAAKFTVFLALILGAFYGLVSIFKKGVFNKGKLGFLNNSQLIEVLSTTYISPKKSLSLIRAHKQIFLVSNSDSGISLISEITDTAGLIKEGEKEITGTNFDLKLNDAQNSEGEIKLKEDIHTSTPVNETSRLEKLVNKTDIVRFSDELKKKAKKLKPIEFN